MATSLIQAASTSVPLQRRMRILQTAHSYLPDVSGVSMVVSSVSKRMAARGHDVHVATGALPGAALEERLDGVCIHRFPVQGNAVSGLRGDAAGYREFVASGQWDVVIMHCAQMWSTDALLSGLCRLNAAKIFVGHGLSTFEKPAYRDYFGSLAQDLRAVQRVFTLSPLLEEPALCRQYGLPEPVVVPNGIDLHEWTQPSLNVRDAWKIGCSPWILALSNHSTVKQHPVFFDVCQEIRKSVPEVKATIVGGHYPAARWNLGRFGIKGGCWYGCRTRALCQPAVSLRYNEPRQRVVSAVQQADVVLVTSSREASPLVVLECMAAGTPWVSLDVGCVRENRGGVVVKTAQEMTSVVVELLKDPQRREQLAREGRMAVVERHDWDKIAQRYEEECLLAIQTAAREVSHG